MSLPPGLLPIARQLHAALLAEIDHEIEIERLVSDGRYARDVLLVCDACPATGLPLLARQFRALVAPLDAAADSEPPAMDMPDSMARRAVQAALAIDSQPMPVDAAASAPASPARTAARPAPRQAAAGTWLQRWWARLGRR